MRGLPGLPNGILTRLLARGFRSQKKFSMIPVYVPDDTPGTVHKMICIHLVSQHSTLANIKRIFFVFRPNNL